MAASAPPFPIEETTIAALHAAYLSGRATAVSVCQAHLDRIAAYDRKGRLWERSSSTTLTRSRMRLCSMLSSRRPASW
jgi:Asp-tRNA(Asn)/Glu-tRNA(Gln) amidotransferase A subunit family amidase